MLKQILIISLLGATMRAVAADLPRRKSGLWEITSASNMRAKAGAMTMSMCVDQNSDANWMQMGQQTAQSKCSKQEHKVERDRVIFSSVCNFGKTTATTKGVAAGDFNKEYKVETHSTYDPPMGSIKEASHTVTAKWLGPCQAGQRPGDVIMPNGQTMNMNDMMKMKK